MKSSAVSRPTWTRRCPRKSGWYFVYWEGNDEARPMLLDGHWCVYDGRSWWDTEDWYGRLWFWPTPIRLPKVRKQHAR